MPNHLVKCIGGPLNNQDVEKRGCWFEIKDGQKFYSTSQLLNSEFKGKYVLSDVYLELDSKQFIRMYIWECRSSEIKKFFYS